MLMMVTALITTKTIAIVIPVVTVTITTAIGITIIELMAEIMTTPKQNNGYCLYDYVFSLINTVSSSAPL